MASVRNIGTGYKMDAFRTGGIPSTTSGNFVGKLVTAKACEFLHPVKGVIVSQMLNACVLEVTENHPDDDATCLEKINKVVVTISSIKEE